jgi:amidase
MPVFKWSNILSSIELEMTTTKDATALLERIHSGKWSAEAVAVAFCKRAAMAQQLVKCLMEIDFDGAIQRAKELDIHFKETGQIVGPLQLRF